MCTKKFRGYLENVIYVKFFLCYLKEIMERGKPCSFIKM